jgi:hypothetical protein
MTESTGMNCEKNAVVCEGYHEKQVWKSGRERAEEGTLNQSSEQRNLGMAAHDGFRTT